MNDQSPPKRVTRARVAAKSTDIKTTKIATAAARAKSTRSTATSATVSSTTKRKTRGDEMHHEENNLQNEENIIELEQSAPTKTTRGRPKRAATVKTPEPEQEIDADMGEEAPAPVRSTRGRPKKMAVEPTTQAEPVRATRGRAKKIEVQKQIEPEQIAAEDAPKRATRGRAAIITKAAAPKKTVKFEEPDKENIVPTLGKGKPKTAEVGTGLRAKPVRKSAPVPAARASRGRSDSTTEDKTEKQAPLSPKKATQLGATPKESVSEDELASNIKTPLKPLMRSPVKPPSSVFGTAKKLDLSASNSITVNRAVTQDLSGSTLASPARRPPQSPFKESMKHSPQRSTFSGSMLQSPFKPSLAAPKSVLETNTFKESLLQSPARRPQSPIKITETGSPTRNVTKTSLFDGTPKTSTFKISRFATPKTVNLNRSFARNAQVPPPSAPPKFATGSSKIENQAGNSTVMGEPSLPFSGRLSSIMPRDADPSFRTVEPIVENTQPAAVEEYENVVESMDLDQADTIIVEGPAEEATMAPTISPPGHSFGSFQLREIDENPIQDDSESEDELASGMKKYSPAPLTGFNTSSHDFASSPATPTPFTAISNSPKNSIIKQSSSRSERKEKIGFTPLARQLSDWMAASPEKPESSVDEEPKYPLASPTKQIFVVEAGTAPNASPAKSSFFDDEMSIREEMAASLVPDVTVSDIIESEFGAIQLDEEDMALALEADDMSLLEPSQLETLEEAGDMFTTPELPREQESEHMQLDMLDPWQGVTETESVEQAVDAGAIEPALSEASQEYGDENIIPMDPALFAPAQGQASSAPIYSTPRRVLTERTFHTVSKVPLKAAADDTPATKLPIKRSASISRLPSQRPSATLSRKNTVISYSPTKSTPRVLQEQQQDANLADVPETPSKTNTEIWSSIATPARTPRRDLDTALLKGAVVFVDVHTTEGADASALFTEVLTQMGAKCVKNWNWSGSTEEASKVGITHVVYKDGGKRTLERVRDTHGVVCCVGVGWVLDCERENKWLDESPYAVDTAVVPRAGGRRRKSMEPRALANLNGTLVPASAPPRATAKEFLGVAPDTPLTSKARRRDSVQWVRSPASSSSPSSSNGDEEEFLLTPVPATPAPETVSAYAEAGLYGDDTPAGQTPYFLHKEQLMQQTAPVNKFTEHSEGQPGLSFLTEKKDESVMMRLMAARRKSLQWAPKVGSPLAKQRW